MARFRFKIVDSQGRRRSGVLRADSLEVAESALRSKLCQIEQLSPLPDDGRATDVGRLETSFSQVDKIQRGLMIFLACLCLLSFYHWWRSTPDLRAAPESDELVQFVVNGKLDTQNLTERLNGDLSSVRVHAVFPELPYQVDGVLSPDGESFSLPVDLVGATRPKTVIIEVSIGGGERWTVPTRAEINSHNRVDIGKVKAEPPEQPPQLAREDAAPAQTSTKAPSDDRRTPKELKAERKTRMDQRRKRRGKVGMDNASAKI